MKEIKAIIEAYDLIDKATTRAALATVVRVEGSSYRRTGARMLVMDNGVWVGGISGGCLEGDALKRARLAITKSASTLITYDTTGDDEFQIGVGLGCNGIIDVLFTPLNYQDKNNPVEILKTCLAESRQTHVLVTVTRLEGSGDKLKAGDVILYNGWESLVGLEDDPLRNEMESAIQQQINLGKSAPHHFSPSGNRVIDTFIEILPPEINVIIMGHQYDVYPLSRLLKEIGWSVTVVANPLKINKSIVAIADQVLEPSKFTGLLVDEHSVIILMSHDYKTDKYNLPKALQTAAPYIGLLGPRSRSEKIWRELEEEGTPISPENFHRVYAPVGLDIGAVTPEEIALSFVAEVRAVLSNRQGGLLRLRAGTIHQRD